jgi:hypothetical protein
MFEEFSVGLEAFLELECPLKKTYMKVFEEKNFIGFNNLVYIRIQQ